ncbi:MAG: pyruvate kinase [Acidobacteriia bacterium]|nr:pyruvate kinase [Terriglobia bacterium]
MGDTHGDLRRVKIVATLGPASANPEAAELLAREGVNVFRLNAAHLKAEQIPTHVELVRSVEAAVGHPLAVFCDLAGPKLRVAKSARPISLVGGATATIGDPASGADVIVEGMDPVRECPVGSRVLVHDGKIVVRVTAAVGAMVRAEVVRGGDVAGGMGVNLPDVETSLPSLTQHDLECLAAALDAGIDACSLSFVRRAQDVTALREHMVRHGRTVPIIAKLEKAQAVSQDALLPILAASDLVMVARGDLGAETSPEMVPVLQKRILQAARAAGVPAITATEMLESMIHEPRPTRAEANDVANAVFDGSDAVMLSAETAVGDHPVMAVAACARIVREAERHPEFRTSWAAAPCRAAVPDLVSDAVAEAAAEAVAHLGAKTVVCFTQSGRTARLVARHRPATPILALTPRIEVARALSLVWGVIPRVVNEQPDDHEEVVHLAERAALHERLAAPGDLLVVTHGAPVTAQPLTNLMRVHRVAG